MDTTLECTFRTTPLYKTPQARKRPLCDLVSTTFTGTQVEVAWLPSSSPIPVDLAFEHYPVWLPSLDPRYISNATILGHSCMEDLMSHVKLFCGDTSLVSCVLHQFGMHPLKFGYPSPTSSGRLALLSGSMSYLQQWMNTQISPSLGVLDHHYSGRLRCGRPSGMGIIRSGHFVWHRVRHETVGGGTDSATLFCTNKPNIVPITTILRRTISCILDLSIRCKVCEPPPSPSHDPSWLNINDRLDPLNVHCSVLAQTYRSRTGWGHRPLSSSELAILFGLPLYARCQTIPTLVFEVLLPIQSLQAMLFPFISSDSSQTIPAINDTVIPTAVLPPIQSLLHTVSDSDQTWLPSLGRFLPHTWVDETLITTKAAKGDNADIPVHLWNSRITLVIPCPISLLDLLRSLALQWQRRRLLTEFRSYLSATFGKSWAQQLILYRHALQ
jgi:hypothetical protein